MASHYTAHAPDIECDGCANAIRAALGRLEGVQNVDVDVATKAVDVEYEPSHVDDSTISERLARAGFPPVRN